MSLPHSNAELVWSVESRRWVCLEHKPGRKKKEDMKAEASGGGTEGWRRGGGRRGRAGDRKFRRAEKDPEGKQREVRSWRSKPATEQFYHLQVISG